MKNTSHKTATISPETNSYNKIPANIDSQIEILESRGMIIDDLRFAKKFLAENYFHRFLSYSVPFFCREDHSYNKSYIKHTKFSDVVRIYEFDSKLRLLILDAIERIEISIKTQFIHLSWKYGPHFYLSHKLFKDHKLLNDSIERIDYQMRVSNDLLVDEYFAKYDNPNMPPVWVAMDLVSIGQLSKWFMNLKHSEDKADIAKHFHLHYSVLQAILDNFTLIRNYSAHHARIWNRHYNFIECVLEGHNSAIGEALCSSDHRIYGVLIIITYVLGLIDNGPDFLLRLFQTIDFYKVNVSAMGFPDDWQDKFRQVLVYGK